MRPRHLLSAAATLVTALVVLAAPAGALDCAAHPDSSPRAVAGGTEEMAGGDGFFDFYDRAVVGTVVDTAAVGAEPGDRSVEHVLAVELVLGEAVFPAHLTVRSTDTGWGVAEWEIGETLFVPLSGPDVATSELGLCTPVHEVDADQVGELRELARSSGLEVATIEEAVGAPPASEGVDAVALLAADPGSDDDGARTELVLGVAAVGVMVVGAGLAVTRPGVRRRS